jgi:hypothetical protein
MKHETQPVSGEGAPVDSELPRGFFRPVSVYFSDDGGEWVVRDYAGQSGRFCVIGPWTIDILASFLKLHEAHDFIEKRAGKGQWWHRG